MRPANGSAVVLKTKAERGLAVGDVAVVVAARRRWRARARAGGDGQVLDDEIQEQVGADVVGRGGAQDREECAFRGWLAQAVDDVFSGSVPFSKNSSISSSLPSATISTRASCAALRGVGHVGRDVAFFALAVAIRRIGVRLHADEVNDAGEVSSRSRWGVGWERRRGRRFRGRCRARAGNRRARDRAY